MGYSLKMPVKELFHAARLPAQDLFDGAGDGRRVPLGNERHEFAHRLTLEGIKMRRRWNCGSFLESDLTSEQSRRHTSDIPRGQRFSTR